MRQIISQVKTTKLKGKSNKETSLQTEIHIDHAYDLKSLPKKPIFDVYYLIAFDKELVPKPEVEKRAKLFKKTLNKALNKKIKFNYAIEDTTTPDTKKPSTTITLFPTKLFKRSKLSFIELINNSEVINSTEKIFHTNNDFIEVHFLVNKNNEFCIIERINDMVLTSPLRERLILYDNYTELYRKLFEYDFRERLKELVKEAKSQSEYWSKGAESLLEEEINFYD